MTIIFVYLILVFFSFFALAALLFFVSVLFGLIITKGVPFISIPRVDWLKMCEAAELQPGQVVYDLGCGKANLLTTAAKNFGVRGVGYEISLWPYWWGRWRIWWCQVNVKILMKNFFQADLKPADVVFCYLFPSVMARLENKFKTELQPGTRVVSYAFKLPNIKPKQVIISTPKYSFWSKKPIHTAKIFVYRF